MYDIEKELALYKLREIEIEDMKLKIEEIKKGDNFGSLSYEDKVQTSISCSNNDKDMNKIAELHKKIHVSILKNRKVDNVLRILSEEERRCVKAICIDKLSRRKATKVIFLSKSAIDRNVREGIRKLKTFNYS
ncbi:MAG: RNA polymerase subunit sigma [Clostridium celatum]|nr:RNA polymerase subunit sigma [Clostridium celatum]